MKRLLKWAMAVGLAIAVSATSAHAQMSMGSFQGYLTGHIGTITGGDLNGGTLAGGVSVAVHETTGWGAEFDFGIAENAPTDRLILDVNSYMFNGAWAKPVGVFRPFALVGAGILQVNGCGAPCPQGSRTYDFALSAGGGTFVALHDLAALRADVRYMFSGADHPELNRPDNFAFWRATVGVTFMWAITP